MIPAPSINTNTPDLDSIAAEWIARRDHGLTPGEQARLDAWLAQPAHAEAFARCEAMWDALPALRRIPSEKLAALLAPKKQRLAPVIWLTGATAAAATIALIFAFQRPAGPPRAESVVQRFAAPVDAEARVALPDGSVAVLHRGSRIAFGEFSSGRRVRLLAGEAHFTVSKSSAVSFFVHAGQVIVRDIGTAFNVRFDPARIAILVTEGSVAVRGQRTQTGNQRGEVPFTEASASPELVLTAGQQVVVEENVVIPFEALTPRLEEVEQALAWKSRRLSFDRTPLSEVIAELNRYNVRQLSIADPSIASVLIAGGVQSDNLDAFVRILESGFGVAAEQQGDEIVLRKGR